MLILGSMMLVDGRIELESGDCAVGPAPGGDYCSAASDEVASSRDGRY
jgi:hypothetical protein